MIILQIEHPVPNYDGWKKAFDSDPLKRHESGVLSFRISRPAGKNNPIMIELEFGRLSDAETMLLRLEKIWAQVEGTVMTNPKARIIEVIETKKY